MNDDNVQVTKGTSYWGEIPMNTSELPVWDVSEDIERSMDPNCLDPYHSDEEDPVQVDNLVLPAMDPMVLLAIQLHKWKNDMIEITALAELASRNNLIPSADAVPPKPEMPAIQSKLKTNILNYMEASTSLESLRDEVEIPQISHPIVRNILVKCVATLTAHIGFETTHQSVLDILVDVLEQFFIKFCDRFTTALNEEETLDSGGFPNTLERVLVDLGLGGAKGLHDFYQSRVIKYVNVLQKRCKELDDTYDKFLMGENEPATSESDDLEESVLVE
ncbi:uncharacterized protein LOC115882033 [Sitophilus oryzae]|uniref:Uncharacterized protein LOC115882033 n=1 Tax=Sitophilus oryzae TaxID=7048 RepID=A0A6J2XXA4_SITOR|nr:uncharacterized protein LOC115882033 [Sitophilus oryzae]